MSMHIAGAKSAIRTALDALSTGIVYYFVPGLIALATLLALTVSLSGQDAIVSSPVLFRAITTPVGLNLEEAQLLLDAAAEVKQVDTRLSELLVWFSFSPSDIGRKSVVEFPSRHAKDIACWNAASELLGSASYSASQGQITRSKAGFALTLDTPKERIICKSTYVGPAHITIDLWPAEQYDLSVQAYIRRSGLLDGGLLVLATFVAVIALRSRDRHKFLFAIWLCLNLRLAALSAGWDTQWLGQDIPPEWLPTMRAVTVALFSIVTGRLFQALFQDVLKTIYLGRYVTLANWIALSLLPAALILSFTHFLPVMWGVAAFCMFTLLASLGVILSKERSPVALWGAAAFGTILVAHVVEVYAAASGKNNVTGLINAVTGALVSSLLIAVAIAERIRQEHAEWLKATRELEHTYAVNPIGLFTVDLHGKLLGANPAAQDMLGSEAGPNWWKAHFEPGAWLKLQDTFANVEEAELEFLSKDSSRRFLIRARKANDKIEGFLQDITTKSRATQDLIFLANNDPLTKTLNRRGIETHYAQAMASLAPEQTLAVAYLDLDRFKLINDMFGHASGDDILCQVSDRVRAILAQNHVIGRVGGDEFLIIMPDTSVELAAVIGRAAVNTVSDKAFRVDDKAFSVRASIGLVEVNHGMPLKDVISSAIRACQEAKHIAGDGLVIYERSSAAFSERQAELDLVDHLSASDVTSSLFMEMQPIMSLRAPAESLNFEVLLRMKGRDGSIIPAGRIIAVAEKSGMMGMIDRWVLHSTLAWIEKHINQLDKTRFICMNLSGASLNDERFVHDALDILQEHIAAAQMLCIEITESVALHDLDNTRRFIDQIRAYGVRVALDDFGAGYTSFSYLKELPADVLKIDGNFIVKINEHPANVAIVEAIVNLAANLGMKIVAEWAEDAATVQTLANIGVDYVQGYAIARPQKPEQILLAASGASFIKDDSVKAVVEALGTVTGGTLTSNVIRMPDPQERY